MMNMMFNPGGGFGLTFLWSVHILSVIASFSGLVLLLAWSIKHLPIHKLLQWAWTLIIVGAVACLLTIAAVGRPWGGYGMMGNFGATGMPMMWGNGAQNNDDGAQAKEEAEGKALYDKLQAKQSTCADLADADFELIGEYVMGQRLGGSHIQMNERIKLMMGSAGEEQMHVLIGKSATGCAK